MSFFGKLLKSARRRVFGRPKVGPRLRAGLLRIHEVLATTPLAGKFWINGGLLLGYAREGQPLAHDDDADFSVWEHDIPALLAALPALHAAGFQKYRRYTNNAGHTTTWCLSYRDVHFEFFEMQPAGEFMQWYCYGGKPVEELLNHCPMHGLEEFEFVGRTWLKPDDHEGYLAALYGDWRTPHPNYKYYRDSRAIIARQPWTGGHVWQ